MTENHEKWRWRWQKVDINFVNNDDDDMLENFSIKIANDNLLLLITPSLAINHLTINQGDNNKRFIAGSSAGPQMNLTKIALICMIRLAKILQIMQFIMSQ